MTRPSSETIDYLLEILEPLGPIRSGRLFGGAGFSSESVQFAMIIGSSLYFVVGDDTRARYEHAGMQPFTYNTRKGEVKVRRYYEVPEDVLADPDRLREWAAEFMRIAKSTRVPKQSPWPDRPGADAK